MSVLPIDVLLNGWENCEFGFPGGASLKCPPWGRVGDLLQTNWDLVHESVRASYVVYSAAVAMLRGSVHVSTAIVLVVVRGWWWVFGYVASVRRAVVVLAEQLGQRQLWTTTELMRRVEHPSQNWS